MNSSRPQSAAQKRPQSARLRRSTSGTSQKADPESGNDAQVVTFADNASPAPILDTPTKASVVTSRPGSATLRQQAQPVTTGTITVPIRQVVLSTSEVPTSSNSPGGSGSHASRLDLKMRIAREAMNLNYKARLAELEGRKSLKDKVKDLQLDILRLQGIKVPTQAEEMLVDRMVLAPKGYGVAGDELATLRLNSSRTTNLSATDRSITSNYSPSKPVPLSGQQHLHTTRLDAYTLIPEGTAARPSSASLRRPQASYVAASMGLGIGMGLEAHIESSTEYNSNRPSSARPPPALPVSNANASREYYDEIPVRDDTQSSNNKAPMDLGDEAFYRHPNSSSPHDAANVTSNFDPRRDIISLAKMVVGREVPSIDPWKATHYSPPNVSGYVSQSMTFDQLQQQRRNRGPTGNGLYAVLEVGMPVSHTLKYLPTVAQSIKYNSDNFGLVDLLMRRHTVLLGQSPAPAQRTQSSEASPQRTLSTNGGLFPDGSTSFIIGQAAPKSRPSSAKKVEGKSTMGSQVPFRQYTRPATAGPRRPLPTKVGGDTSSISVIGNGTSQTLRPSSANVARDKTKDLAPSSPTLRVQPRTVEESMDLLEDTLRRKQKERETHVSLHVSPLEVPSSADQSAFTKKGSEVSVVSPLRPYSASSQRWQPQPSPKGPMRPSSASSTRSYTIRGDGGLLVTGNLNSPQTTNRINSGFVLYGGSLKK